MLSTFTFADNIIGFIVDGPYDDASLDRIQTEVEKKLEIFEKVNLYIEDTANADISPKTVIKSAPFKVKNRNRFEKVAVVTDRKWLKVLSTLEKLFFSADIRIFSPQRRLEAVQWISH